MKYLAPVAILLLAFALRVVALDSVPPGWRDDEVIETTVHAQIVLGGQFPLYFTQAEGHEPLYHYVTAGWIALVGNSLFSVRMVSVIFGLLSVATAYRLTYQLFGTRAALLVALLLAVSFWALMYSRTKIRHIGELPFVLLAFSHLFKAISRQPSAVSRPFVLRHLSFVTLFSTLALYTYLAATTILLILGAFAIYLIATHYTLTRSQLSTRNPKPVFLALVFILILYLPLANSIRENATRLAVVGGPLTALRDGNWQSLLDNIVGTVAMFGGSGDPEALYNIPGRPVFNLVGFYFFLIGVVIAIVRWRDPRYAFLLVWLIGGLAPGIASNPPASLGHTITALPVTYILAVLPVVSLLQTMDDRRRTTIVYTCPRGRCWGRLHLPQMKLLGSFVVLFSAIALSDLPDYFWRWPADPQVRYLYKADLHTTASKLRGAPPTTYVLSGPLSKWDRVAFTLEGLQFESPPRWANAEWAFVIPSQPTTYLHKLFNWQLDSRPPIPVEIRFNNDLTLEGWSQQGNELYTHWQVGPAYAATEPDMGSSVASPPFPVFIFLHLLDSNGSFVSGSDRFDADAFSLQPGDRFIQRHAFDVTPGTYTLEIGLYDPVTGERTFSDDGRDSIRIGTAELH